MITSEIVKIVSTPLFWIVSALGSVALGVTGNLLTPKVAALIERRSSSKRRQTMRSKAKRLAETLLRFDHPDKLTQTKLDSLHSLLVACVLMLLSLVIFTLASALELFLIPSIVRILAIATGLPVVWLALFATKHGLKFREIAQTVEGRRKALEKFRAAGSRTVAEETAFLADWDQKEFGLSYAEAETAMKAPNPNQ
jgi:hypothetical protein